MKKVMLYGISECAVKQFSEHLKRNGFDVDAPSLDVDYDIPKTLDHLAQEIVKRYDLAFIEGQLAYNLRVREGLENRNVNDLPIMVAYYKFPLDTNLEVSGCDFGKNDVSMDLLIGGIATELLKEPIPAISGMEYNQKYWEMQGDGLVRK